MTEERVTLLQVTRSHIGSPALSAWPMLAVLVAGDHHRLGAGHRSAGGLGRLSAVPTMPAARASAPGMRWP